MRAVLRLAAISALIISAIGIGTAMTENEKTEQCPENIIERFYEVTKVIFPQLHIAGVKQSSCQQGWTGVENSEAFVLNEDTDLSVLKFEAADALGAVPWDRFQMLLPEASPQKEELPDYVVAYGFNDEWKYEIHILHRRDGKGPILAMLSDLP